MHQIQYRTKLEVKMTTNTDLEWTDEAFIRHFVMGENNGTGKTLLEMRKENSK